MGVLRRGMIERVASWIVPSQPHECYLEVGLGVADASLGSVPRFRKICTPSRAPRVLAICCHVLSLGKNTLMAWLALVLENELASTWHPIVVGNGPCPRAAQL
eukprot:288451-Amphidinium_carterae.1